MRVPYVLAGCLALLAGGARAQTGRVLVDGVFADWTDTALVHADPAGDAPPGIDLGRLWAARAEGRLLLSFEVGPEINLQTANGLALYLDTDADPATGLRVNAAVGAELEWRFGARAGTAYLPGRAPAPVPHTAIGFFSAPTVTSGRFEVAFRYDAALAGVPIFSGGPVRVVLQDGAQGGDGLPDVGGVLVDPVPSTAPAPVVTLDRAAPGDLRVVSYNVLQDGLFHEFGSAYFRRVLRAVRPDILALQEVYNHSAAEVAAQLEVLVPSAAGGRWYAERAAPGSDVFLASRFPITRVDPLCAVATNPLACNGAFALDLSARYAEDLYVVVAHTPCCTTGNNEALRQAEVDLIAAHLRDARADGRLPVGTPFIVAGDLNLVGRAQQLRTLVTGDIVDNVRFGPDAAPDWDGTDLGDARPLTTGVPGAFTWYDAASDFHPGRLDYVLFSDAVVSVANRFALFTPALPSDVLARYGMFADDTPNASDHLAVVVDLVVPLATSSSEGVPPPSGVLFEGVSPSPTRGRAAARFVLAGGGGVRLDVVDVLGRVVWTTWGRRAGGRHEVELDLGGQPAGVYTVRLVVEGRAAAAKRITVVP